MIQPSLSTAVCVLSIWTIGHTTGCSDQQFEKQGRCCDMCPPGTYLEEFCSEDQQTVCSPCKDGYFSDEFSIFDRCEPCQSCQQEYAKKCTPTTNATCSCRPGFLCSNNICSICEEYKCVTGEKLKKTAISLGVGLIKYSYQCEPLCPEDAYFDAKEDTCKPRTQCSAFGLAERFPGNQTHNSVCDVLEMYSRDGGSIHGILGISCILLSLTLLVFLTYVGIKNLRKRRANNNPIPAVNTNTNEFHLSKEESGFQLIIQNDSKDNDSFSQLHMEKVQTF